MALNKAKLIKDIIAIQTEMSEKEKPDFQTYAEKLATAIDEFVKSGTVTVATGISVTTAGTATAQTGTTTSTGTGTIS